MLQIALYYFSFKVIDGIVAFTRKEPFFGRIEADFNHCVVFFFPGITYISKNIHFPTILNFRSPYASPETSPPGPQKYIVLVIFPFELKNSTLVTPSLDPHPLFIPKSTFDSN